MEPTSCKRKTCVASTSKPSNKEKKKKKVIWDLSATKIFLEAAVTEVEKGNFRKTSFNKEGWMNLLQAFNEARGHNCVLVQMKNKWNRLRDYWTLYKKISGMAGIERGPDGWTIQMDSEWWKLRIAENPMAAKFEDGPPELPDLMQQLFDPVVRNSPERHVPNAGTEHVTAVESENSGAEDVGDPAPPTEEILSEQPTPIPTKKTNVIPQRSCDRIPTTVMPLRWAKASGVFSASSCTRRESFSISSCMKRLGKTPGIAEGSTMWLRALDLFHRSSNREIFMMIDSDEARCKWIVHASSKLDASSPSSADPEVRSDYSVTGVGLDNLFC